MGCGNACRPILEMAYALRITPDVFKQVKRVCFCVCMHMCVRAHMSVRLVTSSLPTQHFHCISLWCCAKLPKAAKSLTEIPSTSFFTFFCFYTGTCHGLWDFGSCRACVFVPACVRAFLYMCAF